MRVAVGVGVPNENTPYLEAGVGKVDNRNIHEFLLGEMQNEWWKPLLRSVNSSSKHKLKLFRPLFPSPSVFTHIYTNGRVLEWIALKLYVGVYCTNSYRSLSV